MGCVAVGEFEGDGDTFLWGGGPDADDSVAGSDEGTPVNGRGGSVRDENCCLRIVIGDVVGPEDGGSGDGVFAARAGGAAGGAPWQVVVDHQTEVDGGW